MKSRPQGCHGVCLIGRLAVLAVLIAMPVYSTDSFLQHLIIHILSLSSTPAAFCVTNTHAPSLCCSEVVKHPHHRFEKAVCVSLKVNNKRYSVLGREAEKQNNGSLCAADTFKLGLTPVRHYIRRI